MLHSIVSAEPSRVTLSTRRTELTEGPYAAQLSCRKSKVWSRKTPSILHLFLTTSLCPEKRGPVFFLRSTVGVTMSKDSQMRAAINQKLIEMGERERLKELLRAKLVECGWKDQLKAHCKDVIREKGLEHVTVEDLVTEVTPKGRALVPDSVKKELLQRIRAFLAQHATL
ncbi:Transcription and mRNA export factor ENY2 [Merluccius polli]|nr:Transcription and mRNA export factor ENY2 [Merluccius polli]